jgi:hypothetical protein
MYLNQCVQTFVLLRLYDSFEGEICLGWRCVWGTLSQVLHIKKLAKSLKATIGRSPSPDETCSLNTTPVDTRSKLRFNIVRM